MTDCGCSKAKAELEEYLHNELASTDAADIREHMQGCTDCSSEFEVGIASAIPTNTGSVSEFRLSGRSIVTESTPSARVTASPSTGARVSIPESMAVMRITISDRGAALFGTTAKMPTEAVSTRCARLCRACGRHADSWSVDKEVARWRDR